MHNNILKIFSNEFIYDGLKKKEKSIDTTIYSEHWYRCPNQSKGLKKDGDNQHIIKYGTMKDFIIYYIPEDSLCIDNYEFIDIHNNKIVEVKNNIGTIIEKKSNNDIQIYNKDIFSNILSETKLYKKLFDECYKKKDSKYMSIGFLLEWQLKILF